MIGVRVRISRMIYYPWSALESESDDVSLRQPKVLDSAGESEQLVVNALLMELCHRAAGHLGWIGHFLHSSRVPPGLGKGIYLLSLELCSVINPCLKIMPMS